MIRSGARVGRTVEMLANAIDAAQQGKRIVILCASQESAQRLIDLVMACSAGKEFKAAGSAVHGVAAVHRASYGQITALPPGSATNRGERADSVRMEAALSPFEKANGRAWADDVQEF